MRHHFRIALLVTSLSAGTLGAGNFPDTSYAEATPVSAPCSIAPRSPSEIFTLLQRNDIATPAATTGGSTLPTGPAASVSEQDEIEKTIAAWLACQNAGESLRAWALFTDAYLYRLLSREVGLTEESLTKLATPTPSWAEPAAINDITAARHLPDGRLGATVTISYPSVPMPKRFFFYFVQKEQGLLIDSILGEISFSVP